MECGKCYYFVKQPNLHPGKCIYGASGNSFRAEVKPSQECDFGPEGPESLEDSLNPQAKIFKQS